MFLRKAAQMIYLNLAKKRMHGRRTLSPIIMTPLFNKPFSEIIDRHEIKIGQFEFKLNQSTEIYFDEIIKDAIAKSNIDDYIEDPSSMNLLDETTFYHNFHIDDYEIFENKNDDKEIFSKSIFIATTLANKLNNKGLLNMIVALNIDTVELATKYYGTVTEEAKPFYPMIRITVFKEDPILFPINLDEIESEAMMTLKT